MSEIIISRGIVMLGIVRKDKDGNIVFKKPTSFEEDDSAKTIIIGKKDESFTPVSIEDVGMILEELGSKIGFSYMTKFKENNYGFGDDSWECMNCHKELSFNEGTPEENEYMFCPYCGRPIAIEDK